MKDQLYTADDYKAISAEFDGRPMNEAIDELEALQETDDAKRAAALHSLIGIFYSKKSNTATALLTMFDNSPEEVEELTAQIDQTRIVTGLHTACLGLLCRGDPDGIYPLMAEHAMTQTRIILDMFAKMADTLED